MIGRGQLAKMRITLEPLGSYNLDHFLHAYLSKYCPATDMRNGTKFCRASISRSRSFPLHVNFTVSYITPEEVNAFLHALKPPVSTG